MLRNKLIDAGVCLALFASALLQAAEPAPDRNANLNILKFNSKEFRAPEGFGGYAWNTPLGKIGRLQSEPVYVRVAFSKGKITHFDSGCYRNVMDSDGDGQMDPDANNGIAAMLTCKETEGEGFHALAEYYVDSQGFRINDAAGGKVVLFPVTYQFCSHWTGLSNNFKGDPLENMRLCGARLHFRSETAAQERAILDVTHRTDYDRTLNWLINTYGPPEEFEREGTVIIPDWDTESSTKVSSEIRYRKNRHWCRPRGEALVPKCDASIVLAFDGETGLGQVIFLTAPVWSYAYARQFGGTQGDPLYRVLHGGTVPPKVHNQCVDSFLCNPPPPAKMPQEMLARFRLANKDKETK